MTEKQKNAVVLTGGGARAAYQVGALQGLAQIRRQVCPDATAEPFGIIVGTSAGAVNASALACHADDFGRGVELLADVWANFSADQVYRTDSVRVIQSGARWLSALSVGWLIAQWSVARPRSLLNNDPLIELIDGTLKLSRIEEMLTDGPLQAIAVTGSNYSTGQHTTFYQSRSAIEPWTRSQRCAVRTPIRCTHLLASAAIPFVFPAVPIEANGRRDYYGDGSMREVTPTSPAIHLGAERILVIGSARLSEPDGGAPIAPHYPNLAQIAGHALSSIFLDALAADIERIERINRLLEAVPPTRHAAFGVRPIEVLALTPSQRVDRIASEHIGALPATIRALLRGIGVTRGRDRMRGAALASYLLFEAEFTQRLMELGRADTLARRAEIERFFGWGAVGNEPSGKQPAMMTDR